MRDGAAQRSQLQVFPLALTSFTRLLTVASEVVRSPSWSISHDARLGPHRSPSPTPIHASAYISPPPIGALTPHRTTPFELPDEVCLLLTDELASPADFYLYSTTFQRLKSGRRVLVVSAADDLARWKAVAGKSVREV